MGNRRADQQVEEWVNGGPIAPTSITSPSGIFDDLVSDVASFGNVPSGNYAEFESNGMLAFHGDATVYADELGDVTRLKKTGLGVSDNLTEISVEFTTSANLSDYVSANIQFNHDRKILAPVYPHVHWWQAQNNIPNFLVQYRWVINGQAKVTSWRNLKCNTNVFPYTGGTMNQISYSDGITPPTGDAPSSILQIRFLRDTNNNSGVFAGKDPYTATVGFTSFDIHKELDTIGSRTEYSK